jgi:hypothetical protein
MKSWTQTHDAHRGLTMLMVTQLDEPRCAADSGRCCHSQGMGSERNCFEGKECI